MFALIILRGNKNLKRMWCLLVFKKELEKDVAGDTSGNFAKLLLALVQVCPDDFPCTYTQVGLLITNQRHVSLLYRPREMNHLPLWTTRR